MIIMKENLRSLTLGANLSANELWCKLVEPKASLHQQCKSYCLWKSKHRMEKTLLRRSQRRESYYSVQSLCNMHRTLSDITICLYIDTILQLMLFWILPLSESSPQKKIMSNHLKRTMCEGPTEVMRPKWRSLRPKSVFIKESVTEIFSER